MKQNLANSIILPPKNGGLKAWSHNVRKANWFVLVRVMRSLQMQQVGRYYYDPTRPALIPQHKLELWPGYITSIQHYQGTYWITLASVTQHV